MSTTVRPLAGGAPQHAWTAETGTAMNLPAAILDMAVTTVRVVVHTMGYVQANPRSENHWTIYLLIENAESVQINFRVGAAGEDDRMTVEHRSYQRSNSAIKYWDFAGKRGTTVRKVLECIYEKGRDSYEMNSEGLGCHYWVLTVVSDFSKEDLCFAKSSSDETIQSLIRYNYSRGQPAQEIEITKGHFIPRRTTYRPSLPSPAQQGPRHGGQTETNPSPATQSSRHGDLGQSVQSGPPREATGKKHNHDGVDGVMVTMPEGKSIFVSSKHFKKAKVRGEDALFCQELNVYVLARPSTR